MAKDSKKTDDSSTGIKSISGSARNAAKRAVDKAKQEPILRGGVCSSCGQQSTSCTTNTVHMGCPGYFAGPSPTTKTFGDPIFDSLAQRSHLSYDGTILHQPIEGTWITQDALQQRRVERREEALLRDSKRIVLTSVFEKRLGEDERGAYEYDKCVCVNVTNGLGEAIAWVDGAWRTDAEQQEYAAQKEINLRASIIEVASLEEDHLLADSPDDSYEKFLPPAGTVEGSWRLQKYDATN